jgi:hypothetical protein
VLLTLEEINIHHQRGERIAAAGSLKFRPAP